ncbi:hypothetical protein EV702DRAFT_1134579 [Suillus placidus]|uniref:Uncharacterized protein n=1 Tax=Suillus placidus TaxID=48579 RepID=A0A9P7CZ62_9AGAM|nr:hypothetical protein EV702DRAFT_1134579 [Suillus placidus]
MTFIAFVLVTHPRCVSFTYNTSGLKLPSSAHLTLKLIWPIVDMPPSSLQAHQSLTLIQTLLQRHREKYPRLLQWRNLLPAPSP